MIQINIIDIYSQNFPDNANLFRLQPKEANRLMSTTLNIQEKVFKLALLYPNAEFLVETLTR